MTTLPGPEISSRKVLEKQKSTTTKISPEEISFACSKPRVRTFSLFSASSQPLNSSAISETLFGHHVVDQFDVEPIEVLSGSTHDSLFFGSMFKTSEGVRGRRASIAAGDAGSTGSLSRNISFTSKTVRYSDSLVPPISFVLAITL